MAGSKPGSTNSTGRQSKRRRHRPRRDDATRSGVFEAGRAWDAERHAGMTPIEGHESDEEPMATIEGEFKFPKP
jgi:hypothetical protein